MCFTREHRLQTLPLSLWINVANVCFAREHRLHHLLVFGSMWKTCALHVNIGYTYYLLVFGSMWKTCALHVNIGCSPILSVRIVIGQQFSKIIEIDL